MNTLCIAAATAGIVAASAIATGFRGAPREYRRPARLQVHASGRFLITEDGRPFFWLADTAWWMTLLRPEEVDLYLRHRARHRFNVIQFHCGRLAPDYAGRMPFRNGDPLNPDEAYWRNVDSIVERAGDRGLRIALAPLWGEEYGRLFGTDAGSARRFGLWIGARFARHPHVVWIVSGEHDSINRFQVPITPAQRAVIVAAAAGIRQATGGRQLMTIHPGAARTSSREFHNEPWLDMNMLQSGHVIDASARGMAENCDLIGHDYGLRPPKPVLDGEPIYEDTPDAIWIVRNVDRPRAGASAVRRKAWWSVFAGACGHTYGHNDVWGFYVPKAPGRVQRLPEGPGSRGLWKDSLDAPGALQMKHLRALIESRPWLDNRPDLSLLASPAGKGLERMGVLRGEGRVLVYSPLGMDFSVHMDRLGWSAVEGWWHDPRTGRRTHVGRLQARGVHRFDPPGEPGEGNDWGLELVRGEAGTR